MNIIYLLITDGYLYGRASASTLAGDRPTETTRLSFSAPPLSAYPQTKGTCRAFHPGMDPQALKYQAPPPNHRFLLLSDTSQLRSVFADATPAVNYRQHFAKRELPGEKITPLISAIEVIILSLRRREGILFP